MKASKPLLLRRILVPIDFSKNAQRALRYVISLAAQFGARIALLHIVKPVVYPTEMAIVVTDQKFAINASRRHLAEFEKKFIPQNCE